MKKQHFSLIELMLALGVVAIGVCSVMVLFPIGANASRDASMETFAAQAVEQLLYFKKYQLYSNWDTNINKISTVDTTNDSATTIPDAQANCTKNDWQLEPNLNNLFNWSGDDGLFQLVSSKNSPASISDPNIDYRVIIRMRRERIDLNDDGNIDNNDPGFSMAVRLIVEASWPAEIPHSQRQTSTYTLDVFLPLM